MAGKHTLILKIVQVGHAPDPYGTLCMKNNKEETTLVKS